RRVMRRLPVPTRGQQSTPSDGGGRIGAMTNTNGVVRVGDGRGFIMEHRLYFDFGDGRGHRKLCRNVVVTASHCLPHAPPTISGADYQLATYAKLLAPLGEEPSVWTQC